MSSVHYLINSNYTYNKLAYMYTGTSKPKSHDRKTKPWTIKRLMIDQFKHQN